MSDTHPTEEARYWNEEGGERWVRYIDRVEAMLGPVTERLIVAVDAQPGERVLDIGCGGGPTSAALAEAVGDAGRVTGVDVSAPILELARSRHGARGNLEFLLADAGTHAFEAAAYDVLCSRFGVMFFPEVAAAFANLRRAARDGSRLRWLVWRSIKENPWMGAPAQAAFSVIEPPEKPAPDAPGPFAFADPERVGGLLEGAGFGDISFDAVDTTLALGAVDDVLAWMSDMGPAAKPLGEAAPGDRARAQAAMREVLEQNATDDGVRFAAAMWLVSARAA
ncbi:MAG: class I SAM-dependent methyltransferase [Gammaproteobacteria bacterium]